VVVFDRVPQYLFTLAGEARGRLLSGEIRGVAGIAMVFFGPPLSGRA
jgi:hypothetical protein